MINIDDNDKENEIIEEESNDSNNVETNEEEVNEETKTNDEEIIDDAMIELQDKVDKLTEESKANLDKYMRTLAEYDNFRKRTQKEKSDMYDKGIIDTVSNFLDVIDNFDRALNGINKNDIDEKTKTLFDGIEMIRSQMDKALNKIGVTAIEASGKEFDPNIHNAVMHVDDESLGENVVAEELQRGYMYNDKVVRHSMVKVAN
ncbi:MAG: nucleotide exchange factor GrpE [Clostridia bacterium]|nr:nucleotide exchange factor GrpE [Clostridia bacterium]